MITFIKTICVGLGLLTAYIIVVGVYAGTHDATTTEMIPTCPEIRTDSAEVEHLRSQLVLYMSLDERNQKTISMYREMTTDLTLHVMRLNERIATGAWPGGINVESISGNLTTDEVEK